jgi:hypothetical protein
VLGHAPLELPVTGCQHLLGLGGLGGGLLEDLVPELEVLGLLCDPGPGDPEESGGGADRFLVEELEDVKGGGGLVGVGYGDAYVTDVVKVALSWG